MFVEVNGIKIFYEKIGNGKPLIMIHGNGENHGIFDRAAEALKDSFTCYLPDSRNHGRSESVKELHYADMAKDITEFIRSLSLEDVILYGFSDGGIIGLLAAAECREIKKLIISGANLTPDGLNLPFRFLIGGLYLFKKDTRIRLMLNEPHIPDETLKRITADTLVLAGSRDIVLEKQTRHIASAIPDSHLKILKGEGHGSYIIHKEKIAQIIKDFVLR